MNRLAAPVLYEAVTAFAKIMKVFSVIKKMLTDPEEEEEEITDEK